MQKVSLLVTTYNVKDNMAVTLESIETQDYADIEVVIGDERYGSYDTGYRCTADYEFMVRFLKAERNRLAYVQEVLRQF